MRDGALPHIHSRGSDKRPQHAATPTLNIESRDEPAPLQVKSCAFSEGDRAAHTTAPELEKAKPSSFDAFFSLLFASEAHSFRGVRVYADSQGPSCPLTKGEESRKRSTKRMAGREGPSESSKPEIVHKKRCSKFFFSHAHTHTLTHTHSKSISVSASVSAPIIATLDFELSPSIFLTLYP